MRTRVHTQVFLGMQFHDQAAYEAQHGKSLKSLIEGEMGGDLEWAMLLQLESLCLDANLIDLYRWHHIALLRLHLHLVLRHPPAVRAVLVRLEHRLPGQVRRPHLEDVGEAAVGVWHLKNVDRDLRRHVEPA